MEILDLGGIEEWARRDLDRRNEVREHALRLSRELVRCSANAIRALHRRERNEADQLLAKARRLNQEIRQVAEATGDVYWAGYVQDAQKELVEAHATCALVRGEPLPDPSALAVAPAPYLNGLAESVGELRRYVLDGLRRGEVDAGEPLLAAMDEIYALLVTMDYPDALTGGLRRSTDSTRAILERTRGDLTLAQRQESLRAALDAAVTQSGFGQTRT